MSAVRVVLAGGGTAGHTSPLIATAERLQATADVDIVCVGTPKGLESTGDPRGRAAAGADPAGAAAAPAHPRTAGRARPGWSGPSAQARRILAEHDAQVAVGFGGYVSLPVYLAARLARRAARAARGERRARAREPDRGPVRPATSPPRSRSTDAAARAPPRAAGADRHRRPRPRRSASGRRGRCSGSPADGPVLLVSGGSQGARSLNLATVAPPTGCWRPGSRSCTCSVRPT